jgi:Domain of unknown function (DUF1707)
MTDLFTWTAGGSYPDISGLLTMSETRPFPQARDQLLGYLHMMSDRYPHSRKDILQAHSDLRGLLESNFSTSMRKGWSRQFTIVDIEPHAVISLSLVRAGSQSRELTRADAEDKMKGFGEPPKPPDPNRRRAGNADRTRYAEHITSQYAIGMLEPAEFEERLDAVNAARYADELPSLIAGLDPLPPPEKPKPTPVTDIAPLSRDVSAYKFARVFGMILTAVAAVLIVLANGIQGPGDAGAQGMAVILLVGALALTLIGNRDRKGR